ncbi:MAG: VCBS repeat-containing protein [Methylococcaceae bacterium]|nr:VCBS repeat-containing protein [Methylococcaceae bacterium]
MKSDFNGNGSSDIMISSPWGLAILNLSSNTLLPSTIAPNGTRFGSWLLNTSDNNFGPNGDFDGDGKTEVLASSPWGIGVLKQSGNTFTSPVMAPNGTRFGDWLLNTADNQFGQVGDYDGDGKAEIWISSPWGIGILKLIGNTFTSLILSPNGARFGEWLLNTADNWFTSVGDFDGDGKTEILASSPWGIGVLKLAGYSGPRNQDDSLSYSLS